MAEPRNVLRILFYLTALVLSGCALLVPKFVAPKLSIVQVQLERSSMWEQQLKVRMRVQNPNDRTLPVKGLAFAIEVAGEELAHGVSGASFVVPAHGEAEFDTDVTANMAGTLLKLMRHGGGMQNVEYHLTGKVSLSAGVLRSIPFDERGTFKLP